ncbi:uncharacterized protein M421DRAFT_425444 [Didymella exigua CBS 183.55]|uniref:Uncharacterized protein n=1 Tax=Didymella exigua CBS 183.55 TaxID=1150837 RepID=A0A6A5R928_9PLEO|nr:uncharacterized protein M421DRAFT_425444 [Didymella exigua CBS 183.55]KAF1923740.1 hypothetical protein M421DRAFT_425444 [Didymella exigua CBS 183.55]
MSTDTQHCTNGLGRLRAQCKPGYPGHPQRCWVGVLLHDKEPARQVEELDFTWMMGHSSRRSGRLAEEDLADWPKKIPRPSLKTLCVR